MYPQAWIDYLVQFHGARDYFECHEILEEYWKENNQQEPIWISLIQFAVSLYHYRRGNLIGARRMMDRAIENANEHPTHTLGIDHERLLRLMEKVAMRCDKELPYEDVYIPLTNKTLIEKCKQRTAQLRLTWCAQSPMDNQEIIHKHKMRDRTQVIQERLSRLAQKK